MHRVFSRWCISYRNGVRLGWRLTFAKPRGLADQQAERLRRRLHLERVFVGIHAPGELDAEALDALEHQALGHFGGTAFAGVVAVIRNQDSLGTVPLECGEVLRR